MRILVTGGAGFIGSHVVEAYLDAGHTVAIYDNFSTGKKENVGSKTKVYEGDITDAERLREVFAEFRPEIVNHHAAQISVTHSVAEPLFDARMNVVGTLTVLETIRQTPSVQKVIYISSGGAMYGNQEVVPIPETATAAPLSPYAQSKYVGEQYVWLYSRLHGVKATVLRYANVYGPRQDPHGEAGVCAIFTGHMLVGQEAKIFGDGTQERDYVYVGDVAAANVTALAKGEGEAINIGTGVGTTTEQVFRALAQVTGYTKQPVWAEARPGEMQRSVLAITKAEQALNWSAAISFASGTQLTVDWYRTQGKI